MEDRDKAGRTLLHYAAADGEVAKVRALLSAGARVDQHDAAGWTPLHFAAQSQAVEIAELLLDAGAPIDAQDTHGNTPLFRAVFESRGRGELIALLRQWGADPRIANRTGQTPVGLARQISNYDVAQYFRDLSAAT